MDDNIYIRALRDTLSHYDVPDRYYRIGGEIDHAVSLMQEDNGWRVYFFDRANRYSELTTSDIRIACLDMLGRMSDPTDRSEWAGMVEYFFNYVDANGGG